MQILFFFFFKITNFKLKIQSLVFGKIAQRIQKNFKIAVQSNVCKRVDIVKPHLIKILKNCTILLSSKVHNLMKKLKGAKHILKGQIKVNSTSNNKIENKIKIH